MHSKRFAASAAALALLGLLALAAWGCASTAAPKAGASGDDARAGVTDIVSPPSYDVFTRSLEVAEQHHNVQFRRNGKGGYFPFAANSWNHFTIADADNTCLYDVRVTGQRRFLQLGGAFQTILELDVVKGACGLMAENLNTSVLDHLQHVEGAVITAKLMEYMRKGRFFLTDIGFLQTTLQAPFQLAPPPNKGFEPYFAEKMERVDNSSDIAYGDIVVYSKELGEHAVGTYVGYGVVATGCCFHTEMQRLSTRIDYHVYRLYAGFAQVNYKVHYDAIMHRLLSNP